MRQNARKILEDLRSGKGLISWALIALAGLLFIYEFQGFSVKNSIDDAYVFALNYFFAHGFQAGKDYIFTYGPLGFLLFPLPVYANLEAANIMLYLIVIILSALTAGCILTGPEGKGQAVKILSAAAAIAVFRLMFAFNGGASVICAAVFLSVFMHDDTKKYRYIILACAAQAVAFSIKQSFGIITAAFTLTYAAAGLILRRDYKGTAMFAVLPVAFTALIWLALYGNMGGLADYFVSAYVFTAGNAKAMAVYARHNPALILAACAAFIVLLAVSGEKKAKKAFLVFLPAVLAVFIQGFTRQDPWHFNAMLAFMLIICSMILLRAVKLRGFGIIFAGSIVFTALMLVNASFTFGTTLFSGLAVKKIGAESPERRGMKFTAFKEELAAHSYIYMTGLEKTFNDKIGKKTVDFYPFFTLNTNPLTLNWRPRPVFQSYISYLPWLDRKNLDYFSGKNAPDFLLFSNLHGKFWGVDDRYVLNDEPLTMTAILKRYKPVEESGNAILMEKTGSEQDWQETLLAAGGEINKPIPLPEGKYDAAVACISLKKTLPGLARSFFQGEKPLFICYLLEDKSFVRYRLSPGNAVNGVWAYPLVTGMDPGIKDGVYIRGKKVKFIIIEQEKDPSYKANFPVQWKLYKIKG